MAFRRGQIVLVHFLSLGSKPVVKGPKLPHHGPRYCVVLKGIGSKGPYLLAPITHTAPARQPWLFRLRDTILTSRKKLTGYVDTNRIIAVSQERCEIVLAKGFPRTELGRFDAVVDRIRDTGEYITEGFDRIAESALTHSQICC